MSLVDAEGLDALTLRALAGRLRVQAPTLYMIHELAADAEWGEWLLIALTELRRVMLAHPDGARIVSGARLSLRRADFSERAMATLVANGVDLQRARMTVLVGERFTVGYVLEEQSLDPEPNEQTADIAEIQRRLPTATRAIIEYFFSGRTADDLYQDGARLILGLPSAS
jgi:TetR/AcrR family tetracycline transcriptional repressor